MIPRWAPVLADSAEAVEAAALLPPPVGWQDILLEGVRDGAPIASTLSLRLSGSRTLDVVEPRDHLISQRPHAK